MTSPPLTILATLTNTATSGESIIFPITPQEIPEQGNAETLAFPVIGLGRHSLPWGRSERTYSLDGYFPGPARHDADLPAWYLHNWRDPQALVDQIKTWCAFGAKLNYHVDGALDATVYIDKYSFKRTGFAGDITFTIGLTEFRSVQIQVDDGSSSASAVASDGAQTETDEQDAPLDSTYTVQPGDNLSLIAKSTLGDAGRWPEIYDANTDTIGPNPSLIQPGMELVIPGGTTQDDSGLTEESASLE